MQSSRDFIIQNIKRQESEGRLEKIGDGLADKIIKTVSSSDEGLNVDVIAKGC